MASQGDPDGVHVGVCVAENASGGFKCGVAVLRPKAPSAVVEDEGALSDDEEAVEESRELVLYAFDDGAFLLGVDALLVREGAAARVVDGAAECAKLDALLARHDGGARGVDLGARGWPKTSKGVVDRVVSCARHVATREAVARHEASVREPLAARAAALVFDASGLGGERPEDARTVALRPGLLAAHMRLDSAAVEAVTLLPVKGAPGSLLEVLGGGCRTAGGYYAGPEKGDFNSSF